MKRFLDLRAVAARASDLGRPGAPTHAAIGPPIAAPPRHDDDRARHAARSAAVATTQRLVGGYLRA